MVNKRENYFFGPTYPYLYSDSIALQFMSDAIFKFLFISLHITANIVLHDCVHVVDVVCGGAVHVVLLTVQSCFQVRLVLGGTKQGRLWAPAGGLPAPRGEHVVPQSSGHQRVQLLAGVKAVRGKEGVVSPRSPARPGGGAANKTSSGTSHSVLPWVTLSLRRGWGWWRQAGWPRWSRPSRTSRCLSESSPPPCSRAGGRTSGPGSGESLQSLHRDRDRPSDERCDRMDVCHTCPEYWNLTPPHLSLQTIIINTKVIVISINGTKLTKVFGSWSLSMSRAWATLIM